jgi:hypothetical protein
VGAGTVLAMTSVAPMLHGRASVATLHPTARGRRATPGTGSVCPFQKHPLPPQCLKSPPLHPQVSGDGCTLLDVQAAMLSCWIHRYAAGATCRLPQLMSESMVPGQEQDALPRTVQMQA